ncbi:MAG: Wzz/FepE/Etk N-terminal domain-containing protein [Pseudomonadota bacterium]
MEHNSASLQDYLAVLRRRRWLILSVLLSITAIGIVVAFNLPVLYKSTAKFLVERPDIKTNLIDGVVTNTFDVDQQIEITTGNVMTQENIRAMIDELKLFPERKSVEPMEDLVRTVRENFLLETLQSDEDDPRRRWSDTIGFEVSYFHERPVVARRVADHISRLYLEENYRSRTQEATESAEFFQQQVNKLSTQIDAMEGELADFKERNEGSLPELRDLNFQVLERAERELESVQKNIRGQTERRNLLSAELAQTPRNSTLYDSAGDAILGADTQLEILERRYAEMSARYGPDHPDLKKLRREIAALSGDTSVINRKEIESSLFTKRSELADLTKRYSSDHPDVRRVEREVQNLESQLAALPRSSVRRPATAPDNPVYISLLTQRNAANSEIVALRARETELQIKLDEYERRLERTPEVEREYKSLTRDYEVAQREYNDMRNKLARAETGKVLEEEQKGQRYTLQKEAGFPLQPAKPNKPAIIVLAFLFALTCAIGGAAVAEAMDSTVRGSKDIVAILDMPPLAIIPKFSNKTEITGQPLPKAAGQN